MTYWTYLQACEGARPLNKRIEGGRLAKPEPREWGEVNEASRAKLGFEIAKKQLQI